MELKECIFHTYVQLSVDTQLYHHLFLENICMYPKSTTPSYGFKTIEALVTSLSSMSQIYQLSKLKQSTRFFLYVTHAINIFLKVLYLHISYHGLARLWCSRTLAIEFNILVLHCKINLKQFVDWQLVFLILLHCMLSMTAILNSSTTHY